MTPNEKLERAHILYEQMCNSYKTWKRGGVGDRISKKQLYNCAVALTALDMPNPFPLPKQTKQNAAKQPDGAHKVTAVLDNTKLEA